MITKDTPVEEILENADMISYFIQNRVSPFSCAGAFPQSLGKLLEIQRVKDPEAFIAGLNAFAKSLADTAPKAGAETQASAGHRKKRR